jgi:hypothetical protein
MLEYYLCYPLIFILIFPNENEIIVKTASLSQSTNPMARPSTTLLAKVLLIGGGAALDGIKFFLMVAEFQNVLCLNARLTHGDPPKF